MIWGSTEVSQAKKAQAACSAGACGAQCLEAEEGTPADSILTRPLSARKKQVAGPCHSSPDAPAHDECHSDASA